MKKLLVSSLILLSAFGLVGFAAAQDDERSPFRDLRQEARQEFQAQRESIRQDFQAQREELFGERGDLDREEFRSRLSALREERAEALREQLDAFRARLQEIRDEHKKAVALRVAENLNRINDKLTDRYLAYLDRLEAIVGKLSDRADRVEERGGDVTAVREAIADAEAAIAAAREAVLEQKAKVYDAEFDDESSLGSSIRAVVQELRNDHEALREEVLQPTKQMVHDAFQALREAQSALSNDDDGDAGDGGGGEG